MRGFEAAAGVEMGPGWPGGLGEPLGVWPFIELVFLPGRRSREPVCKDNASLPSDPTGNEALLDVEL